MPYAVFGDPQSLNLYAYVRNDPMRRADADGHRDCLNICTAHITSGCVSAIPLGATTVSTTKILGTHARDDGTFGTTVSETTSVTFRTARDHEDEVVRATVHDSVDILRNVKRFWWVIKNVQQSRG